ncbi:hypothetical protein PILCRDRAFT_826091 [Piloderma croceum F 1598]|uniref:Uncharacterized protein n=1 Tax=Piloderma croceum (strain F 1598) TaxID=765440 RepID=A0A0C3F9Z0_PILCF|nr:hypothetical protein PILCRDRAFT_826091 [Piloderma croceum F 1598]
MTPVPIDVSQWNNKTTLKTASVFLSTPHGQPIISRKPVHHGATALSYTTDAQIENDR